MEMNPQTVVIGLFIVGAVFMLSLFLIYVPVRHWIAAASANVKISISSLIGMKLRRVPPDIIVNAMIQAHKAGIPVSSDIMEAHFLAGGNVRLVVNALVAADKANMELTVQRATAIDLAGRNVLEAVKMSVNPKVIETPEVAAVAKDGIQLKAIARVTVRANLERLIGGAGEETVLARVGEGIVTTIGSAINHKSVLENPEIISKAVLDKGLDAGTAFEILSIDIADVNIGHNIGAMLQADQADADKNIAQAKAEERRAMAVANEQEMKARISEMKARLIDMESQVPLAIAQSFRQHEIKI
jgi:uncharacterized protein YqfA (UPF0365 family)